MAAVRARRHVAIAVDYEKVPYQYQEQKGGTFDHALGIDRYRASDGAILLYDTLGTNPKWVPQSAVRPAAEYIATRIRGSAGRLFVGLTGVRPLILTDVRYRVQISGYTNLYSAPNGTRVGAVTAATYICTRAKVNNLWWYRILTKADGSKTSNAGRYFKPNSKVRAEYA
jgi:hypothetical protein